MKTLITALTFSIALSFSGLIQAQDAPTKNKSGFGPKIGYYKAPDAEDGTMFIGVQTRTRGEVFGFEMAAEYRGEQSYSTANGDLTIKQIPVTASLLAHVPLASNFQPYGLIGLGAYYTFYDYNGGFISPGDDAEFNIGYHLGFGLDLPLNESAGLNVDYRYLYLDDQGDDLNDTEFSGNVISAGLTFYF